MLIDWFTVAAQLLNFVILVWLMKRFLYKPILHAIDEREDRIAMELANAAASQAEARQGRDEFQHKNEEFDHDRAALMSKAKDEADKERRKLLDEARTAADAMSAKRLESMRSEERRLRNAIALRTQHEVLAIARSVLTDLSSTTLEARMGEVFAGRLRAMDGQPKSDMATALTSSSDPAVIRSAFDLSTEQRARIQTALNESFSADVHVRYEVAPDLVAGIELTANGQKMA